MKKSKKSKNSDQGKPLAKRADRVWKRRGDEFVRLKRTTQKNSRGPVRLKRTVHPRRSTSHASRRQTIVAVNS